MMAAGTRRTPGNTTNEQPEEMPDRMPEDVPHRMPEDMPDRMPKKQINKMSWWGSLNAMHLFLLDLVELHNLR